MTPEEIRELGDLSCKYFNDISEIYSKMPVGYRDSLSNIATLIDFIRKDLKKIVADAVKEAVGTLNSDRKPVYPYESALDTLGEKLYVDDTGKHPIVASYYYCRNNYRNKLLRMGITHYEDIHGYITDSPIAAPYSILVNDTWMECPSNFTDYDFAGLSEDMKLLGLDFYSFSFPMKKVEESSNKRKANEPERHHIDDVQFNYSDTRELLDSFGVNYLDEIKGYKDGLNECFRAIYIFDTIRFVPYKNFDDIKAVMKSYCVPFQPIENQE